MAGQLKARETDLPGVLIIEPKVYHDSRGHLLEAWHRDAYAEIAIAGPFTQDVVSRSSRGVLRGLHFQQPHPQGKLVQAARGRIFDVAVDIRAGSPTFGRWTGAVLSDENRRQMWVPHGFAHGYLTLSEGADVAYKCTDFYTPESARAIAWNDPRIGIQWPALQGPPILSERDRSAPALEDAAVLPEFVE